MGSLDPQKKVPMSKDGIFRIYSMTKPIVSVAVMMLFEDGKLALGDPVAKYIPAFKDVKVGEEKPGPDGKATLDLVAAKRPMTVQDLMRHSSGLTYGFFGTGEVKKTYLDAGLGRGRSRQRRVRRAPGQAAAVRAAGHDMGVQLCRRRARPHRRGRDGQIAAGRAQGDAARPARHDRYQLLRDRPGQAEPRMAEPFANDRSFGPGTQFSEPREARKLEFGRRRHGRYRHRLRPLPADAAATAARSTAGAIWARRPSPT